MPFQDRSDAGRRLASVLARHLGQDAVVLALPRGGAPVGAEVAAALDAPLDLVLVRKIGAPGRAELAVGAVADSGGGAITVRNEDVIRMFGVDEETFASVRAGELAEIERRRRAYLGHRAPVVVAGRLVIVVDDGVATGATTRAALQAVKARGPAAIVLAVPVGAPDVLAGLQTEADEIVCLEPLGGAGAIGAHYGDFSQVADEEVVEILSRYSRPAAPT